MIPPASGAVAANRAPFLALLGANAISLLGTRLTQLAIPWFVLQTTGSATKTGIVGFVEMLPVIIASFLGGTLVDRLGFARGSVLSDLLTGAAIALIPTLHHTTGLAFWQLLLLVFCAGLVATPGQTARQSLVPDLAARAGLPLERANALYQAVPRLSLLLGPALGAALIALLGTSEVLWLDAASYLVSAALVLATVRLPGRPRTGGEPTRYLDELRDGLRFIRQNQLVRGMIGLMLVVGLFDTPLFGVVLPVYADRVIGSVVALGTLLSAFGGGSLAGMLLYSAVGHRLPRRATLATGFAAAGLPVLALTLAPPVWLIAALAAVSGLISGPLNPLAMTLMQEQIPAELRGRVFGLVFALGLAVAPLGMLLAGAVIDTVGLGPMLGAIGAAYLAAGAIAATARAFRDLTPATERAALPLAPTAELDRSHGAPHYLEGN
ncbi:MAG: MFS transporter [Sphaerobacter sp.]|nr:MFS transporter [Sphaerobacter sp.]